MIGEIIADKSSGKALATVKVEEPTVKMSFSINISSFVGREEAFVDSNCDESLIFEMLDFKKVTEDDSSVVWFLQYIAREQDEEESTTISKDNQGMEAPKSVRVYLRNFSRKLALMCLLLHMSKF
ncbi:uncharacterized protein LOC110112645 isoform X1 [Dendrobium catenatum]|nr:uncharacterized protein LOC110112645 isoform X1 [Dendrobium catenatum]XP_028556585.1 uncharacterized protein LOC110112645 isoform X1 [Dendrobium catenatum]XP_028556586.1 uncharacterized protein LOC110112645 isoform X1 [Dendrobium catenatum]XP_028556587.1 uncharacterized protein LOC110112645 isoform X1 [Dendrobium catenatum]XP_028556588.1 uncharacterized protein LOC110112645 isoform X1 [Dendrobium catenatum]XP_028556589.1 uncharacterized protein LOC110112645 isoform X1 [Dendrobium catenatum]